MIFNITLSWPFFTFFADSFKVVDFILNRPKAIRKVQGQFKNIVFGIEFILKPSVHTMSGHAYEEISPKVFKLIDTPHQTQLFLLKVPLKLTHSFDCLLISQQVNGLLLAVTILITLLQLLLAKYRQIIEYLSAHRLDFFCVQVRWTSLANCLHYRSIFQRSCASNLESLDISSQKLYHP